MESTDVLVIGSGIAGLCAAIEAARTGATVTVASDGKTMSGSSFFPGTWGLGLIGPVDEDDEQALIDTILAVGGGVVGDLGGFCAASYMRGIDFVNCPTTTLSQIDSSIGGKTAIDLGETKNIVGAFWQPKVVLVDFDALATLPRRHFVNGLAEAIKAGLIADPELFALFECEHPEENIERIIYRSLRVKKNVVENDEHEQGQRACLNFGHTIGHGIEAVKGVRGRRTNGLFHGECVALGMLPMIEDKSLVRRTRAIYRTLGLPTRTGVDKNKVLSYMQHDKKSAGSTITVIKVPGLGCWRADKIPMTELPALLGIKENED